MIILNLIPPVKKAEFRLTQFYIVVKNVIMLILILAIIVAIVLLAAKATLENYFSQVVDETTLTTRYANIFNRDIKVFNQQLSAVDKIQQSYVWWTVFFRQVSSVVPSGVSIDSITIHGNNLLITGTADTRDELLGFKTNLESLNILTSVDIPLDDLLKKTNIGFNIKATIDLSNLRAYDR